MFRMRLRKRIVGVLDTDGQFTLLDDRGNKLNLKLTARDIRSIRQALIRFQMLSVQQRFKQQFNYVPSRSARDKLARIYRTAYEISVDAAREAAENAFEISLDEAAASVTGRVQEFLNEVLA
jgi:hypothetical protein